MNDAHGIRSTGLVIGLAAAILSAPTSATAAATADFYKETNVDLLVGSTPGGGYDGYGRLIGRHIGKHLPGTPTVVVRNMPGAGGVTMVNHLYNIAPRDGSTFAILHNNMTVEPMLGNPATRFEPDKFTWIGSANKLVNVCVAWHTVPVRTSDDLRNKEWLVAGTTPRDSTVQMANVFIVLGGAKLKVVKGYPGSNSTILSLTRGENQIACGIGWDSIKSSTGFLQSGEIRPVMQLGYEKHPELQDVPFIYDMLVDPAMKPVLDFLTIRLYVGRAFAAPPNIPAERTAALRAAFAAALADPALKAEAEKRHMELQPATGEEIQKEVTRLIQTPKSIVEIANKVLENQINIIDVKLNWLDATAVALGEIRDKGRRISFGHGGKTVTADTEGAKITVAEQEAKAVDLKPGLVCNISYLGDGDVARTIACR